MAPLQHRAKVGITVGALVVLVVCGLVALRTENSDPRVIAATAATASDSLNALPEEAVIRSGIKAHNEHHRHFNEPSHPVPIPMLRAISLEPIIASSSAALPMAAAEAGSPDLPLRRRGVGYTINADLSKRRFNLDMGPELREWIVAPANWRDPEFRKLCKVDAFGNFPVRIWRQRFRRITHVGTVMVPAGPGMPVPPARYVAPTHVWQAFDTLIVDTNTPVPCLMVVENEGSNLVVWPYMSGLELSSGDPSQIFGAVTSW